MSSYLNDFPFINGGCPHQSASDRMLGTLSKVTYTTNTFQNLRAQDSTRVDCAMAGRCH